MHEKNTLWEVTTPKYTVYKKECKSKHIGSSNKKVQGNAFILKAI